MRGSPIDRGERALDSQNADWLVDGCLPIPFSERLTCSVADACTATGLGKTKIYELISDGVIRTKSVGRRRLVMVESLRAWLSDTQ